MKKELLLLTCLLCSKLVFLKRIEDIDICPNSTDCEDYLDIKEEFMETTKKENTTEDLSDVTLATDINHDVLNVTVSTTETITSTTSFLRTPFNNIRTNNRKVQRIDTKICECDLMTISCDINCCCDKDCTDFHMSVFSFCEDHLPELFDSRYCYSRNFIDRNNTPFILEKLANNLFCILYDNLPPTYNANEDLIVENLEELKIATNSNKFKWNLEGDSMVEYNISNSYHAGDIVWKLEEHVVKPLELLQRGFTEHCTFKKISKYLENLKYTCLQSDLTELNTYLFPKVFNNFSIISSPDLFNETYFPSMDEMCPKNVCLSLNSHYCQSSWNICNSSEVSSSCTNGKCINIVHGVKYVIIHNGTMGIRSIDVYFNIGNASSSFYQYFEIIYKWTELDDNKIFERSGNPGYIHGKPIVIGNYSTNETDNKATRFINIDNSDHFMTLPFAEKNGACSQAYRYTVGFMENIKLKCSIRMETNNFTSSSCIELQNQVINLIMKDSLSGVTEVNQYKIYVSKSGNLTNNDTSDWRQILLDRIPHSVVTGQLINGQLRCSGLITSARFDVLYSTLPKPESLTNHNILGVGVTFSNEEDIFWQKCLVSNCTDSLKIDVINYVMFHDVTKPSKYYFVGGPNLDITLPYDFFYPFLSSSSSMLSKSLTLNIFFCVVFISNVVKL